MTSSHQSTALRAVRSSPRFFYELGKEHVRRSLQAPAALTRVEIRRLRRERDAAVAESRREREERDKLERPRPARPGQEFVTALIGSRRQERAPPRVKLLVVSPRDPQP